MENLKEKVVVVTGASSGIGKGCAEEFAACGSFLTITGRNVEALDGLKLTCIASGVPEDKVLVVQADLEKDEDIERVISSTIFHFGRIDVLVNNAGIGVFGTTEQLSMADYDRQMRINLRSPFYLTKLALPHLIQTKGNVINISSIFGLRALPEAISYGLSKACLDQFTRSLALEVADRGVRVNAVNPGIIKTQVGQNAGMTDEEVKMDWERHEKIHPLGRVGDVHDVSKSVVFLASSDSSFTTGASLSIDAGWAQVCPR